MRAIAWRTDWLRYWSLLQHDDKIQESFRGGKPYISDRRIGWFSPLTDGNTIIDSVWHNVFAILLPWIVISLNFVTM
jgi:hypothetical protein